MVELIDNKPKKTSGTFTRITGFSLQTGAAVAYVLEGFPFKIEATRTGVTFQGSFPMVKRAGVLAFQQILIRAVRHHEHLATFPIGSKQTILPEEILEAEEASGAPLPDAGATGGTTVS